METTQSAAPATAPPSGTPAPNEGRKRSVALIVAVPATVGLIVASLLIWQSSQAAFTGSTENAANSWTAGSVALTDDDSGAAMFSATGLNPGDTGERCITVTYGGSTTADVRLYVPTSTGAALRPYIDLVIEEGTGSAGFGTCAGFVTGSTLFTGTLEAAAATNVNFASGWSNWAPTGAGQSRTYRFTYTLNAATPNTQQGNSSTATFQWEAQTP